MKMSNYEYRQILLENQKALEEVILNVDMLMSHINTKETIDVVDEYFKGHFSDSNTYEQKERIIKGVCCELIAYLGLMKKALYEGKSLSNEEWQFLSDYDLVFTKKVSDEVKNLASKRMVNFIKYNYKDLLDFDLTAIKNELDIVQKNVASDISKFNSSKEEEKQKRYERILKIEEDNVSNELMKKFNVDKRVLYSVQHNIMKYDIENEKDESKAQKKLSYFIRWKRYILDYQKISRFSNAYFIEDDSLLYEEYRKIIPADIAIYAPKFNVFLLDCLMFEPYNATQIDEKDVKSHLKLSSDYLKDVLCKKYKIFTEKKIDDVRSEIKKSSRRLNKTNEKIALAVASTAIFTVATGGAASAFAPAIAVALVGKSFVGLSGAALTSASLAFLGGGSLAVGGLGMAGGATAITSGGAILGLLSGASSSVIASVLFDGVGLQSCIKLLTLNNILQADTNCETEFYDIKSICSNYISSSKEYLSIVNDEIKDLEQTPESEKKFEAAERKQKLDELKKVKKNIEKNISYYEKTKKYLDEDFKKIKEKKAK